MRTLTRQECVDLLSDKLDDFNTREAWFNFDIENFLRERGACTPDIDFITGHYNDHLVLIEKWFDEHGLPDELFEI